MSTYVVKTHEGDEYNVEADAVKVDPDNTNRVTFVDSEGEALGQENDAKSVRPA